MSLSALVAGCSYTGNIPTTPPHGRSEAEVASDEQTCTKLANGQKRDDTYTACMISRGYTTFVQAGSPGMGRAQWRSVMTATRPLTVEQIAGDLRECEAQSKRVDTDASQRAGAILAGGLTSGRQLDEVHEAFVSCMVPRGYKVDLWWPEKK